MPRLRVRMELNRGGVGVPLQKLARVVDEAQKFFRMLGDDVHIDRERGEWLGFDFDNKSLNFTAEFVGPVNTGQVREFHAAFDGVTLLRRATIAQFARIADGIGEDELIGFGLYQDDRETEPSEWRSLSKREALRITEEIRLLLDRAGDNEGASPIPAALDSSAAATLFKDRREHGGGERRVEALAQRVERLETEVTEHSGAILNLQGTTTKTEQNLQNLLVAVDSFCDKASRQIERLPAPEPGEARAFGWRIPVTVAAVLAVAGWLLFHSINQQNDSTSSVQAADPATKQEVRSEVKREPVAVPAAPKRREPARALSGQRIDLKANQASWLGVVVDEKPTFTGLLAAGEVKTIESAGTIRLRVGNAAGVEIIANGKPVGSIGGQGQVRIIELTANGFRNIPLDSLPKQ